jgi:hypothetical protein
VSKTRKFVQLDHRGRIAIGQFARHDMFLLVAHPDGSMTLTPADVLPIPTPPVKRPARTRAPRKKAAPAAAESPQE